MKTGRDETVKMKIIVAWIGRDGTVGLKYLDGRTVEHN